MKGYKILYLRYKRKLKKQKRLTEALKTEVRWFRKSVRNLLKRVDILEDGYVISWCCHCESQITMLWDVQEEGLSAYCPHCGAHMMLCDYCPGECDYNYGNDICKEM